MRLNKMSVSLLLTLILMVTTTIFAASPFVIISAINGRAEIQKKGDSNWILVKKGTKLFDNDAIRALADSRVELKWENGNCIHINSESQLLINLYTDYKNNTVLQKATLFYGAAFFIIKKILPREISSLSKISKTTIYTPTSVIAIRGTAFSVVVDKKNGTTQTDLINGTIEITNIAETQSLYLEAGYKTIIKKSGGKIKRKVLNDDEITELKSWVGDAVIDNQIKLQLEYARLNHNIITGKINDRIIILPLNNKSSYNGKWKLSEKLTIYLAEKLKSSFRIDCEIIDTTVKDYVEFGKATKSRFVLFGDITKFDISQRTEVSASAKKLKEFSTIKICTEFHLVDVLEKKEIFNKELCGEVSRRNIEENRAEYLEELEFDMRKDEFANSFMGETIKETMVIYSNKLAEEMGLK